ncbi:hypothetical protein [Limosilactobacillus gastricus]|uniref:hypothetical protein n=1 Tax=Limosilactobacillus gastricus TaxID=227942 RepID=UPI0002D33140|nr:hypothetical protein [Limosilactobacillus gastricus]
MGNDDYKADLDAVNITDRMNQDSFIKASADYYQGLESNKINRSKEFKQHFDYDYLYDTLTDGYDEQTNQAVVKNETAKRFLYSIKHNKNELSE